MTSVLVLVPTYNRPEAADVFLTCFANSGCAGEMDILVCDSSDDEKTKVVADSMSDSLPQLCYVHVDDPGAPDLKAIACLPIVARDYDYVWMCADGIIPHFVDILDRARPHMENGVDVICVDDVNPYGLPETRYDDAGLFFRDCAWRVLQYGATIVSSRVFAIYEDEAVVFKYAGTGFAYQMLLFEYLERCEASAVYSPGSFYEINPGKAGMSEWSNRYLWQWTQCWSSVIEALPGVYGPYKETVIRSHDEVQGMLRPKTLLRQRYYGGLRFQDVVALQGYLERTCCTSYVVVKLISLVPKFLLAWIPWYRRVMRWARMRRLSPEIFGLGQGRFAPCGKSQHGFGCLNAEA